MGAQVPIRIELVGSSPLDLDYISDQFARAMEEKVARGNMPRDICNRITFPEPNAPPMPEIKAGNSDWKAIMRDLGYPLLQQLLPLREWEEEDDARVVAERWEHLQRILLLHGCKHAVRSLLRELFDLGADTSRARFANRVEKVTNLAQRILAIAASLLCM